MIDEDAPLYSIVIVFFRDISPVLRDIIMKYNIIVDMGVSPDFLVKPPGMRTGF